jgi:hypothetical protein
MSHLGVKDPVAMNLVLPDKCAGVFAEIMKNFYDFSVFKDLL